MSRSIIIPRLALEALIIHSQLRKCLIKYYEDKILEDINNTARNLGINIYYTYGEETQNAHNKNIYSFVGDVDDHNKVVSEYDHLFNPTVRGTFHDYRELEQRSVLGLYYYTNCPANSTHKLVQMLSGKNIRADALTKNQSYFEFAVQTIPKYGFLMLFYVLLLFDSFVILQAFLKNKKNNFIYLTSGKSYSLIMLRNILSVLVANVTGVIIALVGISIFLFSYNQLDFSAFFFIFIALVVFQFIFVLVSCLVVEL
ncbi:MAG: hypothetical protein LBP35_02905 [Candidatus Ancillula trichonymphae]|nr:hypothetical protein [Candidatus Ancillula trichonymphae]